MAVFKCSKCKKVEIISKYRIVYKNGNKQVYNLDKNQELICSNCKSSSMDFIPEKGNFGSVYSSFSGLSPLEKQKLLRKRSDDDAKKQKYREQDREKVHFNA